MKKIFVATAALLYAMLVLALHVIRLSDLRAVLRRDPT